MARKKYIIAYENKIVRDYQRAIASLPSNDRIKFGELLIDYTKLHIKYYKEENETLKKEISDFYREAFLKSFGSKMQPIVIELNFFQYFDPFLAFVYHDIVSLDHINNEMDPQGFTNEEFKEVLDFNLNMFQGNLEFLYYRIWP